MATMRQIECITNCVESCIASFITASDPQRSSHSARIPPYAPLRLQTDFFFGYLTAFLQVQCALFSTSCDTIRLIDDQPIADCVRRVSACYHTIDSEPNRAPRRNLCLCGSAIRLNFQPTELMIAFDQNFWIVHHCGSPLFVYFRCFSAVWLLLVEPLAYSQLE